MFNASKIVCVCVLERKGRFYTQLQGGEIVVAVAYLEDKKGARNHGSYTYTCVYHNFYALILASAQLLPRPVKEGRRKPNKC